MAFVWVLRTGTKRGSEELPHGVRGSDLTVVPADGAVIELATRCTSADEFIERFARFTTATDVVVPALPRVRVGTEGQFVIRLQDRSVMMQGRCEVTEIRPLAAGPGAAAGSPGRALMRLHLREMDAHSAGIHLRLMERHATKTRPPAPPAPSAPPPPTPARTLSLVRPLQVVHPSPVVPKSAGPAAAPTSAPAASPLPGMTGPVLVGAAAVNGSTGVVMAVAATPTESEPTEISPRPAPETRVPGAALTLPANPLSDLDADDLAGFIELKLLETDGVTGAAPVADRARRVAARVAPYAACVLAGLVAGIALRPAPKDAPKKAPIVVAPSASPPAAVAPSTEPAPAEALPTPARRDCIARVTTTPSGAAVFWGEVAIGSSPIEHAVIPCGPAVVTFRHERYAPATRAITSERGRTADVEARLFRPAARLVVTSSPPRALITMNRHRFGPAPRKINTLRYEHLRLEASLPGYRPWKKTLYLKDAEAMVDVTLVPIPRPIAKPAPRRARALP